MVAPISRWHDCVDDGVSTQRHFIMHFRWLKDETCLRNEGKDRFIDRPMVLAREALNRVMTRTVGSDVFPLLVVRTSGTGFPASNRARSVVLKATLPVPRFARKPRSARVPRRAEPGVDPIPQA